MNRRKFFFSVAGFSALLATPTLVTSALATSQMDGGPEAAPLETSDEIKALEAFIKSHPDPFPWSAHNELRHLYITVSEAKSMGHADAIFAHSFMDDYTLSILSDWQLEKDPERAIVALLNKTERHPSLAHLRAACLMKAGDVCREHDLVNEATRLYQGIIALKHVNSRPGEGIGQYHTLAQLRLSA